MLISGVLLVGLHIAHYLPRFPALSDLANSPGLDGSKAVALLRTLAWLAILNLGSWALGGLIERRLHGPADFRLVVRLGLGFATLSVIVLVLAGLHALRPAALYATVLLPAAVAATLLLRKRRDLIPALQLPRWKVWILAGAALLLFNAFLGVFSLVPEFDALTYHVALPERYLFANGIVVTPFSHFSAFPFLAEMLNVVALFLVGPSLAALLHFEFGVLLVTTAYIAARRVSRTAGIIAAAIFLADPLFQRELSWAYNDLTFAFYALLAFVITDDWARENDAPSPRLAGVLAGIAMLVKVQGIFVLLAVLLLLWLPRPRRGSHIVRASLIAIGFAFLTCSPWLLRNFVFTGNPVAPLMQSLFRNNGAPYFDPVALDQSRTFLHHIGMGRGLLAMLMLPWNLVMRTVPYSYDNSFGYQITPLYVVAPLAIIVSAVARRQPVVKRLLLAAGCLAVPWFVLFQEARYLLPALACLTVAGAVALADLSTSLGRLGRIVFLVLLAGLLYTQALMLQELPDRYREALAPSVKNEGLEDPIAVAAASLRANHGADTRVLLIGESRGYYFRGMDYVPYHSPEGPLVLQWIHNCSNLDSLCEALRRARITHILVNTGKLQQFPPVFLPSYSEDDYHRDLALIRDLINTRTKIVYAQNGIFIGDIRNVSNP